MTIETRYGTVDVARENIVTFQSGLLGFDHCRRFILMTLPDPRLERFRVLQGLDDTALSFIVAPLDMADTPIAPHDLEEAIDALALTDREHLVLTIVSVRREADGVRMTTNLRAPIIVDVVNQRARQVILPNPAYDIRHPI